VICLNKRVDFYAKIEGNVINIDFKEMPKMSKSLKVYLHSSMVNLEQKVEVVINGKLKASRAPRAGVLRNMDQND
jgi:hypothetical protein